MSIAATAPTRASVEAFIETVGPSAKREEAQPLDAQFRCATGAEPRMWGPSIIGYGKYRTFC